MKKVMFSFLIGAFALVSCSKDETGSSSSTQEISVSATPISITSFISENYPDAAISAVLKYSNSDTSYAITLNTCELLAFDQNESLIGESMYDAYCDSLNGHHGGGHHGGGHHGGGHHGGGGPHGEGIPIDSLPAAITDYIAANYSGYTAHNARYDTLCQFGVVIDVMADSTFGAHKKLIFDANGIFLAIAHRLKTEELPAAVSATLATSYAAFTFREKAELFILADSSKQYRVFMHNNVSRLSVTLNEDGTVVCEL